MSSWLRRFLPKAVSDEEIIAAISSFMLSTAVGASRGEWGGSITFEEWFFRSRATWLPTVKRQTRASTRQVKSALEKFVGQNRQKTSMMVFREVCQHRGEPVGIVIQPGESVRIEVSAELEAPASDLLLSEDMACPSCGVICVGDGALENHVCEQEGG